MKHYKKPDGSIWAFEEDGSQDSLITPEMVFLTPFDLDELRKPPPPTPEELQAVIVVATQARLDAWARTRNYDGILSACTYATSAIPKFAAEGKAAVDARDSTWAALYALLADVQAGTTPMPTSFADVESHLPALSWP